MEDKKSGRNKRWLTILAQRAVEKSWCDAEAIYRLCWQRNPYQASRWLEVALAINQQQPGGMKRICPIGKSLAFELEPIFIDPTLVIFAES